MVLAGIIAAPETDAFDGWYLIQVVQSRRFSHKVAYHDYKDGSQEDG